jgi:hypothetical protein
MTNLEKITYRVENCCPPTDTTEGQYVVVVQDGHGLAFGQSVEVVNTHTARVYFVRDSDGKHELAWTGSNYDSSYDPNKRKSRAQANLTLGRLRAFLKSKGYRWEWERHKETLAKRAEKKARRERNDRFSANREAILDALKAFVAKRESLGLLSKEMAEAARLVDLIEKGSD